MLGTSTAFTVRHRLDAAAVNASRNSFQFFFMHFYPFCPQTSLMVRGDCFLFCYLLVYTFKARFSRGKTIPTRCFAELDIKKALETKGKNSYNQHKAAVKTRYRNRGRIRKWQYRECWKD